MPNYPMWEYQQNNFDKAIDFYSHGGHSLVLQQPTGTGKSRVAVEITNYYKDQSKPVYFISQSGNLVWQFSDALNEYGCPHGIVKSGCPTLNFRVQVVSVQSLMSRSHLLAEPYLCIFEECHHAASAQFKRVTELWPNAKILGLTATPGRPDGKPLDMFEEMILSPGLRWFIDNAYLADYDYYIPAEFDTSGIHGRYGDFNTTELAEAVKKDKARVGNFVSHYEKYAKGLPGIAFGVSIADAENIAESFNNSGYPMQSMHSKTPNIDSVLRDAKSGKYNLLSTCDLIGEGTDIKRLTCMLDGRSTQSIVIQIQHWGRPLRALYAPGYDLSSLDGRRAAMEAGGKGKAKILDFSSNYLRHGLPDDERGWSLKGKIKEQTGSKYKRCPSCQRPVLSFARTCPYCGYEWPVMIQETAEVKERDGELVPIGSIKPADKQIVIRAIAREASDFGEAVAVAKRYHINSAGAWCIWTKLLRNEVKNG